MTWPPGEGPDSPDPVIPPSGGSATGPYLPQSEASKYVEQILRAQGFRIGYHGTSSVCRRVSGLSTYSQHSWGNAIDIVKAVSGLTIKQVLEPVAQFLWDNRVDLGVAGLIWDGRSWFSGRSDDDHYDHIHVSFWPQGVGVPSCWRGASTNTWRHKNSTITTSYTSPMDAVPGGGIFVPPSTPDQLPLSIGDHSDLVKAHQLRLNVWFPYDPLLVEDGTFGAATEGRVKVAQKFWELSQTGIIDQALSLLLSGSPPVVIPLPPAPVIPEPIPLPEYDAGFGGPYRRFYYPRKGENDPSSERTNQGAVEDYLNKKSDYTQNQINEITGYLTELGGLTSLTATQLAMLGHEVHDIEFRGGRLYLGHGHPHGASDIYGISGDQYIDLDTGDMYILEAIFNLWSVMKLKLWSDAKFYRWNDIEGWKLEGNIWRPPAAVLTSTPHGPLGARGSVWSTTDVMPPTHTPTDGWKPGDVVMHTTDGELFHYTATGWADEGVSILGPQGIQGVPGHKGDKGDPGEHGTHGDPGDPGTHGDPGIQGQPGPAGVEGHIGPAGHSIHILSVVATPGDLPTGLTADHDGDAHLVRSTGDLMIWSDHDQSWHDLGHIAGPAGARGEKGDDGIHGEHGIPGTPGLAGAKGDTGGIGHIGPAGAAGHTGAAGAAGGIGPIGHAGLRGSLWTFFAGKPPHRSHRAPAGGWLPQDQWLDTVTGHVWNCTAGGATGTWVDEGISIKGPAGPRGVAGPKGSTGLTGPAGAKSTVAGPRGARGAASTVAGPKGSTGAASHVPGPKGNTGATGHIGATGPKGATGSISDAHGDARYVKMAGDHMTGDLSMYSAKTIWFKRAGHDVGTHFAHSIFQDQAVRRLTLRGYSPSGVPSNGLTVDEAGVVRISKGKLIIENGGNLGERLVRNIWLSNATPTHPIKGDIWMHG